jgi:hypothetical protein
MWLYLKVREPEGGQRCPHSLRIGALIRHRSECAVEVAKIRILLSRRTRETHFSVMTSFAKGKPSERVGRKTNGANVF